MAPPKRLRASPVTFKGWKVTPPKVKNPIMVWMTDLPTPTREVVRAEQTEVQRNCEYVSKLADITRRMKVG